MTDMVNQPPHYTYGDIEVIDYCDQICSSYPSHLSPYVFNALKYISRSQFKNGKQDIDKAIFYLKRLSDKYEEK